MDKDWKCSKQAIRYLQVASQGTTGTKFGIVDCWSLKAKKVFCETHQIAIKQHNVVMYALKACKYSSFYV